MQFRAAWAMTLILLPSCDSHRTYAEGCGALPKAWITPRQGRSVLSLLSVISVSGDDVIDWNGQRISEASLQLRLKRTGDLNPVPVTQIIFAPDVDCERVRRLRALLSSNLDCTSNLCAEGAGKWWFVGDVVSPGHPVEPYDPDGFESPQRRR